MLYLLAQQAGFPQDQDTTLVGIFRALDSGEQFVLFIIGLTCLTAVVITSVCILAGVFYNLHRRRCEDTLKREMLDRGMTAEEIQTVIRATPPEDFMERMADRKQRETR